MEGFSRPLSRRFQEGFLEGVCKWALEGGRVLRRVLRRGSEKGLSRRHLEGARFARIDSQIRANRLTLANRLRVPELNPFFLRIELRIVGLKIANRRVEAIRVNRTQESLACYENRSGPRPIKWAFLRDPREA